MKERILKKKMWRVIHWAGMLAAIVLVLLWSLDVIFWGRELNRFSALSPMFFVFVIYYFYRSIISKKKK